jgi:hypothetical protein
MPIILPEDRTGIASGAVGRGMKKEQEKKFGEKCLVLLLLGN